MCWWMATIPMTPARVRALCAGHFGVFADGVLLLSPPLDPAHMPDPREGPDAEIAKFMYEEVTPTMADLLGVTVGDLRSGRGFGCFSCHPTGP